MSIIDKMKQQVASTGQNLNKVFYVKNDGKRRVRFLAEMDEAYEIPWHEEPWREGSAGVKTPCRTVFGEECPYCGKEGWKHYNQYALPVYDVETDDIKIMVYKYTNQFSPYPHLMECFESYGTIKDRDYIIKKSGSRLDTNFTIVAMDKAKFMHAAKYKKEIEKHRDPKTILEIIKKANPLNNAPTKMSPQTDESDGESMETEVEKLTDGLNAKATWELCGTMGIEVPPQKIKDFYVAKLNSNADKVKAYIEAQSANSEEDWDTVDNAWDFDDDDMSF